jgi:hypothetical protein
MKFGYFCNTTNWDHKPYNQLLDETKEITTFVMKIIGTQFGILSIILIMKEWSLVQIH